LWDRVRGGDADAFIILFRQHAQAVYNFCFRRTADWSTAEDLTSVVFFEAWRHRAEIRCIGESVLPWLYGVASNAVRNHRRGSRRRQALLLRLSPVGSADFTEDIVDRMDAIREVRALLSVIGQLPRRQQDVVVLCLWQGLTHEQAACALGLAVGTVKSRVSRAKARIRSLAASDHQSPTSPSELRLSEEGSHGSG
jgi:RNA polymerase sigma factor (sigma-70 family)